MIRSICYLALLATGLASNTGCHCWQGFFKGDLCAECDPYGGGTFYCGDGCGDGCNGGCGEKYHGDWISHPPDSCEPCDRCGNFVGGRNANVPYQMPRGGVVSHAGFEGEVYDEGYSGMSHAPMGHGGSGCACGAH